MLLLFPPTRVVAYWVSDHHGIESESSLLSIYSNEPVSASSLSDKDKYIKV